MSLKWNDPPRSYVDIARCNAQWYSDERALTVDYRYVRHNTRSLDEHYNTLPEGVHK